jgi:ABC-2 type transport system permease protein/sodium transport system permease protein
MTGPPKRSFDESNGAPQVQPRMRGLSRLVRLTIKELREILRDRRTILTLVLMPILVYPLVSVVFQRYLISSLRTDRAEEYRIGVTSEANSELVREYLQLGQYLLQRRSGGPNSKTQRSKSESQEPSKSQVQDDESISDDRADSQPEPPKVVLFGPEPGGADEESYNLEQRVSHGQIDLGIRVRQRDETDPPSDAPLPPGDFELISLPGSSISLDVREYVQRRMEAINHDYLRRRLEQFGESPQTPAGVRTTTVNPASQNGVSLATLIPLILILMTVTGAVYPAIDLTAGERERGTLEALISAPVPRMGLLFAKYVAVMSVAILTASVNLLAMTGTIYGFGLESLLFGSAGIRLITVLQVIVLMILFAAFFSAMLLVLTSFARSFKEAQAYLIPLMLVSLAPGLVSLTPGLEMNGFLAVTPLVNIVLVSRDLFNGAVVPVYAAAAVVTTILYAALALLLAARIFGTDAVLYGSGGSWSDVIRRPSVSSAAPNLSAALFCMAVMFPLFILSSGLPARLTTASLSLKLALSGGISVLLFVLVPLSVARFARVRLRDGFSLRFASATELLGAALLGLSLWAVAYELVISLFSFSETRFEEFESLLAHLESVPLAWKLVFVALIPAACEEFFFRGYLLSSLRTRCSAVNSVLLSAFLFGLFHVVVRDSLFLERLLPSTLMGLVLGWVCLRTGSLFPGMLLHLLHNGLFMLISEYRDLLASYGLGAEEGTHLPYTWMAVCAILIAVGFLLLRGSSNRAAPALAPEAFPPVVDDALSRNRP